MIFLPISWISFLQYVSYLVTSNVHGLVFVSEGKGDGGGVTEGCHASDRGLRLLLTFLIVKKTEHFCWGTTALYHSEKWHQWTFSQRPLDDFQRSLGQKNTSQEVGMTSDRKENRNFKPKLLISISGSFFLPKPKQHCQNSKQHKETWSFNISLVCRNIANNYSVNWVGAGRY